MKPKAIICDVDGTVALRGSRGPYDLTRVSEDKPNLFVISAVFGAWMVTGYQLIFTSGREEIALHDTREWLESEFCGTGFLLLMRGIGDQRPDDAVKQEMLDKISETYDVFGAFDDRNRVVDMWRRNGIPTMQVCSREDGDF